MKNLTVFVSIVLLIIILILNDFAYPNQSDQSHVDHQLASMQARCKEDSLNFEQALIRLKWAYKCKKINWYSALPQLANSGELNDMSDDDKFATFLGNTLYKEYEYYLNGNTNNTVVYNGLNMFIKYPTYSKREIKNNSTIYSNPLKFFAPGHVLSQSDDCEIPAGYNHYITCVAGCFRPDQKILTHKGYEAISDLYNQNTQIIGLHPNSVISDLQYKHYPVSEFVRSLEDSHEILIGIETALGGNIVVTLNHPMLLASGYIVNAENLKVGDKLLRIDGTSDKITQIQKIDFWGKVINLSVAPNKWYSNIIVSQGFLTGSHWYQVREYQFINRQLFRTIWLQQN